MDSNKRKAEKQEVDGAEEELGPLEVKSTVEVVEDSKEDSKADRPDRVIILRYHVNHLVPGSGSSRCTRMRLSAPRFPPVDKEFFAVSNQLKTHILEALANDNMRMNALCQMILTTMYVHVIETGGANVVLRDVPTEGYLWEPIYRFLNWGAFGRARMAALMKVLKGKVNDEKVVMRALQECCESKQVFFYRFGGRPCVYNERMPYSAMELYIKDPSTDRFMSKSARILGTNEEGEPAQLERFTHMLLHDEPYNVHHALFNIPFQS